MASVFTRVQQLVSKPGLVICMLVREIHGPDAATVACGVTSQLEFSWPGFCFPEKFANKKTPHQHTSGLKAYTEGNSPCRGRYQWHHLRVGPPLMPLSSVTLRSAACASATHVLEHFLELLHSTLYPSYQTNNFEGVTVQQRARLLGPFTLVKMVHEGILAIHPHG